MQTAEDIIREKDREILSITRDISIYEALRIMVSNKVGAILIRENEKFIGVWRERDLLRNPRRRFRSEIDGGRRGYGYRAALRPTHRYHLQPNGQVSEPARAPSTG